MECAIGLCLLIGVFVRAAVLLLLAQMAGTLMPLVFFPAEMFAHLPTVPTFEGQYILKNIVLITAALVIGTEPRDRTGRRPRGAVRQSRKPSLVLQARELFRM